MHNLPTIESIRAALDQPLGKVLRVLIEDRLADPFHCGLQNLTHKLVGISPISLIKKSEHSRLKNRYRKACYE